MNKTKHYKKLYNSIDIKSVQSDKDVKDFVERRSQDKDVLDFVIKMITKYAR
jgi:hypothetical protein